MYPVQISGRRLTVREFADADAEALHAMTTDPRVADRIVDEGPPSVGEIRAGVAAGLSAAAEGERRVYRLAACLVDELVGLGTLRVTSVEHRRGELGYLIHPDHQGQGLATELAGLLVGLGFEAAGLHRIEATTRPDHPASFRILEKVGMTREGTSRDHLLVRGAWWDSLRYAILANDPRPAVGGPAGR